ncbi:Uncharacterized protein APZ42_032361 [Daphnia magna]|uniref:Integrase catalytic domain-containing protein n=1 Tax=Daphnia magna TaxID=35525 RepID=A0A164M224_9CRUS|nr:Uncharacterized protein APZ42_032361 [Daphnia magna]
MVLYNIRKMRTNRILSETKERTCRLDKLHSLRMKVQLAERATYGMWILFFGFIQSPDAELRSHAYGHPLKLMGSISSRSGPFLPIGFLISGPQGVAQGAYQRTVLRLQDKYYWLTMLSDVKEYFLAYEPCTPQRRSNLRAFLYPLDLTSKPFELLGLDFLLHINPHCLQRNNHVLVITNYFNKWVKVIALPDQTALTTSQALIEIFILYHGPPKAIVTDRGSNLTSELFSSLCKKLKIKQLKSTAYHPQTNSLTKRFNKTVAEMLWKFKGEGFPKWENMLGPVAFLYRNSVHSSSLETPSRAGNNNTEKCNETGYNVTAAYHAICLPHNVQLAIKDGLLVLEKVAKGSLNLLGKIVGGIRRSVVDTKTLMDCVGFKIPMLNQTRWSSQYGMIKGSLEAMDKDPNIQSKLNSCAVHGSLTAIQIKSLRELVILLGPFKIATDAFQKEHETIGLVIPFYLDLVNKCSLDPQVNPEARSINSCKTVAEALQKSLKTRLNYFLNDSLYLIGSILDPRIKKSFIEVGGLDEKAVLRAVSDIILSRYRITC